MSGLTKTFIDHKIHRRRVIVFSKATDVDSVKVKQILDQYSLSTENFECVEIDKRQDCRQVENYLRYLALTDRRQSPYIFIDQLYFGSLFELNISHKNGSLKQVLTA